MDDELNGLQNNQMFQVKDELDGRKTYNRRLVEDNSLVVKMTTIISLLNVVAFDNLHLEQLDVNRTDLLDDNLEGDIQKTQLESDLTAGKKKSFKKKESFYGMKKTFKLWQLKFDNFMNRDNFKIYEVDCGCYLRKLSSSYIILVQNIDVVLIVGSNMQKFKNLRCG